MARVEWVPGWYDRIDHEVNNFMTALAKDVWIDMVEHAPVRTGALKADLGWEYSKATKTARIGAATVPYAIYVEEGTRPHTYGPETKGALYWKGARHPVKIVNHPGATATHFMKNALYKERRP